MQHTHGDITGTEAGRVGWCVSSVIPLTPSLTRLYGVRYGETREQNILMAREIDAEGAILWERELLRAEYAPDWGQLSEACVIRHDSQWILCCWNQEGENRSGIHIYTSSDGLDWQASRFNPAITGINDSIGAFVSHADEFLCYQQQWTVHQSPGRAGFRSFCKTPPHVEKCLMQRHMGILYGKENDRMTMFENLVGPVALPMPGFEGVQLYKLLPFLCGSDYRAILWYGRADDFRCWDSLQCRVIQSADAVRWQDAGSLPPGRWCSAPLIRPDGDSWWWKERDGLCVHFTAQETRHLLALL